MCVRITDMRGVDLNIFDFDWDVTTAFVLMHPDGTVYHRMGGRDHTSATSHLGVDALTHLMRETLADHAAYAADPDPPPARDPLYIDEVPPVRRAMEGKDDRCIHCHQVWEGLHAWAREEGRYEESDIWVHPEPAVVGITLDPVDQDRVTDVERGSAARRAGLRDGDVIVRAGDVHVRTYSDLTLALHRVPWEGGELPITWLRDGEEHSDVLRLKEGWREGTPRTFGWRPSKWKMRPRPGMGGPVLDEDALAAAGLPRDAWAFRINYVVNWGDQPQYGREVGKAGLRKGDIVYAVAGRNDFADMGHFHAWWRLTMEPGDEVEVRWLRDGERHEGVIRVVE